MGTYCDTRAWGSAQDSGAFSRPKLGRLSKAEGVIALSLLSSLPLTNVEDLACLAPMNTFVWKLHFVQRSSANQLWAGPCTRSGGRWGCGPWAQKGCFCTPKELPGWVVTQGKC